MNGATKKTDFQTLGVAALRVLERLVTEQSESEHRERRQNRTDSRCPKNQDEKHAEGERENINDRLHTVPLI